jgi:hypothetical protein
MHPAPAPCRSTQEHGYQAARCRLSKGLQLSLGTGQQSSKHQLGAVERTDLLGGAGWEDACTTSRVKGFAGRFAFW